MKLVSIRFESDISLTQYINTNKIAKQNIQSILFNTDWNGYVLFYWEK